MNHVINTPNQSELSHNGRAVACGSTQTIRRPKPQYTSQRNKDTIGIINVGLTHLQKLFQLGQ